MKKFKAMYYIFGFFLFYYSVIAIVCTKGIRDPYLTGLFGLAILMDGYYKNHD